MWFSLSICEYTRCCCSTQKEDEISSGLDDDDVIFFSLLGFLFRCGCWLDVVDIHAARPELLDQEEVEELIAEYLDLEVEEPEEPIAERLKNQRPMKMQLLIPTR